MTRDLEFYCRFLVPLALLPISAAFSTSPMISNLQNTKFGNFGHLKSQYPGRASLTGVRRLSLAQTQGFRKDNTQGVSGERVLVRRQNENVRVSSSAILSGNRKEESNIKSRDLNRDNSARTFAPSKPDSLTSLMTKICKSKAGTGQVLRIVKEAQQEGKIKFSGRTYTTLISACNKAGHGGWAIGLEVLNAFRSEVPTTEAISICRGAKSTSNLALAEATPRISTGKKAPFNNLTVSDLADRFKNEQSRSVLEALAICYGAAIGVCASNGGKSWTGSLELLTQMREDGLTSEMMQQFPHCRKGFGSFIYGNVIRTCANAGEWRESVAVLESMGAAGAPRADVTCYNAAIIGCDKVGQWSKAASILEDMRANGVRPNIVSYGAAVSACSQAGRNAGLMSPCAQSLHTLMWQLFDHAKEDRVPLDAYMFYSLANACARVGDAVGAIRVLKESAQAGILCDEETFKALLLACARAKDSASAVEIFNGGKDVLLRSEAGLSTVLGALASGGPEALSWAERIVAEAEGSWNGTLPAACYFNLLDVAHEVGDKQTADRIAALIRERGVTNKAAVASFDLNGNKYTIENGDTGNGDPFLCGAGHELVKVLQEKTAYTFNYNTLLVLNAPEAEKAEALCCHAEKTALGTLLLRSKAQRPKVSVNIRMCRDCHDAFEHSSALFGSTITCDDGSAKHVFRNGSCSCMRTWR